MRIDLFLKIWVKILFYLFSRNSYLWYHIVSFFLSVCKVLSNSPLNFNLDSVFLSLQQKNKQNKTRFIDVSMLANTVFIPKTFPQSLHERSMKRTKFYDPSFTSAMSVCQSVLTHLLCLSVCLNSGPGFFWNLRSVGRYSNVKISKC